MGERELYLEYLNKFPDNQNIVKLREAVEEGDSETAMRQAHSLKGMALNLGLLPLADVCMDMILEFHAGRPEEAMKQMGIVENCFQQWADAIKK